MEGYDETASFFSAIHGQTSRLLDAVADAVAGAAHSLRDGTEHDAVELPRDLWAHEHAQTEWWYYTGHLQTEGGRKFGFEWVFFKRRTDLDRFNVVPLRLIGNPFYFAHFAITDHSSGKFRYDHRKSANRLLDQPAHAGKTHYYLKIGDWSAWEAHGTHHLRATLDSADQTFEAALRPTKPAILNGDAGVSFKDTGEASRYFAYTRMHAEGILNFDGKPERFTGSAWMDREFGTWMPTDNQKGWDWFSIQLDNGCELMCYQLRDGEGRVTPFSSGAFVDANGRHTKLAEADFEIAPTSTWKSPRSGAEYPSEWNVRCRKLGLDLLVSPVIADQELDTRGTTMIVYWEGACAVRGTLGSAPVAGNAYVELVGYDRSHESPNLAYFLMGVPGDIISKLTAK